MIERRAGDKVNTLGLSFVIDGLYLTGKIRYAYDSLSRPPSRRITRSDLHPHPVKGASNIDSGLRHKASSHCVTG